MTGEHSRNDELEQDDDFYVLGDDDTDVSSPREVAPPGAAPRPRAFTQTTAQEEDELFAPTDAQRAVGPESSFTEKAGRHWGGKSLSAEDIGIPIERDEHGQTPVEPTLEEGAESTEGPFAEDEKLEVIEVGTSSPRLVAVEPESDLGLVDDEQGAFHEADELAAAAGAPHHLHPLRKVHPTDSGAPARSDLGDDTEEIAAHLQDLAEQAPDSAADEAGESELGAEPTVFLDEAVGEEAQPEGDDAWAPIDAPSDPLAAGVEEEAPEEVAAELEEAQPEFAEVEAGQEAFVDAGPEPEIVAGAGDDRPRRRGGWLAAAALVLVAGGGFFAYQRGWLTNTEPDTTIQRADVPRPKGFQAPEPPRKTTDPVVTSQPTTTAIVTEPVVEPVKEPVVEPVKEPVPEPVREPVQSQPSSQAEIAKVTEPSTPVVQKDPEPEPKVAVQDPAKDLGVVQIGEGLTMQEAPKEAPPKSPKESMRGLVPGSQAFAQLHNGNFFVGNVKALDAEFVTLRLEKGEVTLAVGELKTIVPLASSEYQELKRVDQGFVRLNNRNRLLGTILTTKDENIILENKANRVVIPKSAIEELGTVGRTSVRLADEDNSWVDRVIEKQMQDRGAKPEVPQGQDGGSGTRSKDKLKVKSVVGDDAAARPK